MFIVLIRTVILYSLVILVMRLMGKRQIGELQPYEFVITIMISDLAALPMQDTRLPLILGIIPIVTLLFIKTILTQLQLKSQTARKILEGEPSIIIRRGKINYNALKKQQINLDELMEELRLAGYFDLTDIEYAILENNGQMSFLTSSSNSSGTSDSTRCCLSTQLSNQSSGGSGSSSDSSNQSSSSQSSSANSKSQSNSSTSASSSSTQGNSNQSAPKLPVIYVLDGHINNNSLTTSGHNKAWIQHELNKHHAGPIENILIAMSDTTGKFMYQLYDEERTK